MSNAWNEGYFTDEGYTYSYSREINPVFLRYCLLLRGFATLDNTDGVHCELGFGQGVSVNIHATANPGGFVGTDFHPGMAAHAIDLAAAANNGARLYDDSFEQLLARTDLPQFDSISLHGIWTWVSRDNQKLIVEFARRHLKPGGMLYVSYNCFPGWSPSAPLRNLFSLHDRFANASSRSGQRIDAALQFSEAMLAANPNTRRGAESRRALAEHQRSGPSLRRPRIFQSRLELHVFRRHGRRAGSGQARLRHHGRAAGLSRPAEPERRRHGFPGNH